MLAAESSSYPRKTLRHRANHTSGCCESRRSMRFASLVFMNWSGDLDRRLEHPPWRRSKRACCNSTVLGKRCKVLKGKLTAVIPCRLEQLSDSPMLSFIMRRRRAKAIPYKLSYFVQSLSARAISPEMEMSSGDMCAFIRPMAYR